jgi:hypothetical protein
MAGRNEPNDAAASPDSSAASSEPVTAEAGQPDQEPAQAGSRGRRGRAAAKPKAQAEPQAQPDAETRPHARPLSLDAVREQFAPGKLAEQTPEERIAAMRGALEILKGRRPPGSNEELMEIIRPLHVTRTRKSKERGKAVQHHVELARIWHEIEAELAETARKAR